MNFNPTDTPFGPPDPTPAVERAAKAIVREEGAGCAGRCV